MSSVCTLFNRVSLTLRVWFIVLYELWLLCFSIISLLTLLLLGFCGSRGPHLGSVYILSSPLNWDFFIGAAAGFGRRAEGAGFSERSLIVLSLRGHWSADSVVLIYSLARWHDLLSTQSEALIQIMLYCTLQLYAVNGFINVLQYFKLQINMILNVLVSHMGSKIIISQYFFIVSCICWYLCIYSNHA